MHQNILRNSNVTKIYLNFVDEGRKNKIALKLKFIDKKLHYFSADIPINFKKPKKKTPAELVVYTSDGVYKSSVAIMDSSMSLNEVLYTVTAPIAWNYKQLRSSSRKEIELPFTIKFNDGYSIEGYTFDIAMGGISFYSKDSINSIYTKISGILTLVMPEDLLINFPDKQLITEAKFVRQKESEEYDSPGTLYIFKFMMLTPDQKDIFKQFLLKLD